MKYGPRRCISDTFDNKVRDLKVPLQKGSLEICRAADSEDRVRAVPCFHQGGDGLPQVQVVQVTGRHAFGRVDTSVDLHLQRQVSGKMQIQMEEKDNNSSECVTQTTGGSTKHVVCLSSRARPNLRSLGLSLESYLVEFAGHLGVFLPQRLAEGQGAGSSYGQETRPGHQQLFTCATCGTKMREGGRCSHAGRTRDQSQ